MAKPKGDKKRLPVKYPSVPDLKSEPGKYNEPAQPGKPNRMPAGGLREATGSRAEIRLRIEQLLMRRDSVGRDEWANLGNEARDLLIDLVDDEAIRSNEAIRHRVLAMLGELVVKRGVAPLSGILSSGSETPLTKAYAATALGHIGGTTAVQALAGAVTDRDDMVRRQVAKSLARLKSPETVPHLLKLREDRSVAVAEVAATALQDWERRLGQPLGKAKKLPAVKARKKKLAPAPDR
jgi:HEAT repeat protein